MAETDLSPARTARRTAPALVAAVVATVAALSAAPPAEAATRISLGAVGDVATLSRSIGAPLDVHAYARFEQNVPAGRMITVRTSARWSTVAAAAPGSALYDDIVRWADTVKARPGRVMVAYHHEPEASGSAAYGTAGDFVRAWRRVVTIFRSRGVRNAEYTWQMTDWAFRTSPGDARHAARWYPGDAYVDNVGADAYNWYTCGHGKGRWVELGTLAGPMVAFARAHGKAASLPEFASYTDGRRAAWLDNARAWLVANRSTVSAAFYFQHDPTNPANLECRWKLGSSAEHAALRRTALDPAFGSGT